MENGKTLEIKYLRPLVREKTIRRKGNVLIAFLLALLMVSLGAFAIIVWAFSAIESLVLISILVILYGLILPFLIEPVRLREVKLTAVRTIQTEKPVEKVVTRVVQRPVAVRVKEKEIKTVTAPIKRFNFVGSNETRTYHKMSCRLGKLIKRKFRETANTEKTFKDKRYKPCKVCLAKRK